VKVVFSLEPSPLTTVMIATAMPAAMIPYSIAVAADSSRIKWASCEVTPQTESKLVRQVVLPALAPAELIFFAALACITVEDLAARADKRTNSSG
jgi:hypothetical protein